MSKASGADNKESVESKIAASGTKTDGQASEEKSQPVTLFDADTDSNLECTHTITDEKLPNKKEKGKQDETDSSKDSSGGLSPTKTSKKRYIDVVVQGAQRTDNSIKMSAEEVVRPKTEQEVRQIGGKTKEAGRIVPGTPDFTVGKLKSHEVSDPKVCVSSGIELQSDPAKSVESGGVEQNIEHGSKTVDEHAFGKEKSDVEDPKSDDSEELQGQYGRVSEKECLKPTVKTRTGEKGEIAEGEGENAGSTSRERSASWLQAASWGEGLVLKKEWPRANWSQRQSADATKQQKRQPWDAGRRRSKERSEHWPQSKGGWPRQQEGEKTFRWLPKELVDQAENKDASKDRSTSRSIAPPPGFSPAGARPVSSSRLDSTGSAKNNPKASKELKLTQASVGMVIGKNGETLKRIQNESGAHLDMDQGTRDFGYSMLRITGKRENVHAAAKLVSTLTMRSTSPDPLDEDWRLKVDQKHVAFLIGKKGETVQALKEETKVHIYIDQSMKDKGYSVVHIEDGPGAGRARELISAKIRESKHQHLPQEELLLEQRHIGWVIGRNGETVKNIEEISGAKVWLEQGPPVKTGFRSLCFAGEEDAVRQACQMVQERMDEVAGVVIKRSAMKMKDRSATREGTRRAISDGDDSDNGDVPQSWEDVADLDVNANTEKLSKKAGKTETSSHSWANDADSDKCISANASGSSVPSSVEVPAKSKVSGFPTLKGKSMVDVLAEAVEKMWAGAPSLSDLGPALAPSEGTGKAPAGIPPLILTSPPRRQARYESGSSDSGSEDARTTQSIRSMHTALSRNSQVASGDSVYLSPREDYPGTPSLGEPEERQGSKDSQTSVASSLAKLCSPGASTPTRSDEEVLPGLRRTSSSATLAGDMCVDASGVIWAPVAFEVEIPTGYDCQGTWDWNIGSLPPTPAQWQGLDWSPNRRGRSQRTSVSCGAPERKRPQTEQRAASAGPISPASTKTSGPNDAQEEKDEVVATEAERRGRSGSPHSEASDKPQESGEPCQDAERAEAATPCATLCIHQCLVGRLIGYGGCVIKQICEDTGAKVQVDQSTAYLGYSQVNLFGTIANTTLAREFIEKLTSKVEAFDYIKRTRSASRSMERQGEEAFLRTMRIEQSKVGWIIGRKGNGIREISEESGARLRIDQSTHEDGYSIITFIGPTEAVRCARTLVEFRLTAETDAIARQQQWAQGENRRWLSPKRSGAAPGWGTGSWGTSGWNSSSWGSWGGAGHGKEQGTSSLMRTMLAALLGLWYLEGPDGKQETNKVALGLTTLESGCARLMCKTWTDGVLMGERAIRIEGRDIYLGERDRFFLDAVSDKFVTWVDERKPEACKRWSRIPGPTQRPHVSTFGFGDFAADVDAFDADEFPALPCEDKNRHGSTEGRGRKKEASWQRPRVRSRERLSVWQ